MKRDRPGADSPPSRDRTRLALAWYRLVQQATIVYFAVRGGIRATGRENLAPAGPILLVSNHLSFLDVFVLGALLPRPLNYVARSTLFKPVLGPFIRSIGAFPIQRDGMGSQGFKETLKRLRVGGIVTFFPEGTRSPDGELGPLKEGISTLATRARAPIVPVGLAGTFEAWPRTRLFPRSHPIRLHYGPPIPPEDLVDLSGPEATAFIRARLLDAIQEARRGLERDLDRGRRS
jgi:1-acyl-sn-glycerol-3-phosphate acyltransferase